VNGRQSLQAILDAEDPPHLLIREDDPDLGGIDNLAINFPTIIKLRVAKDLPEWKEAIRGCFTTLRILRFIDNTAKVPDESSTKQARVKYLRDRAMAHWVLRQSIEASLINWMTYVYGWKDEKDCPQALYDTAIKAVTDQRRHRYSFVFDGL
jgi:hypothetical protein